MAISLSFHTSGARDWPNGYWYAHAGRGSDYDATGATPLDAVTGLANKLSELPSARTSTDTDVAHALVHRAPSQCGLCAGAFDHMARCMGIAKNLAAITAPPW